MSHTLLHATGTRRERRNFAGKNAPKSNWTRAFGRSEIGKWIKTRLNGTKLFGQTVQRRFFLLLLLCLSCFFCSFILFLLWRRNKPENFLEMYLSIDLFSHNWNNWNGFHINFLWKTLAEEKVCKRRKPFFHNIIIIIQLRRISVCVCVCTWAFVQVFYSMWKL